MSATLRGLMEAGQLPPLCYYFARFIARGSGADEDSALVLGAALVSFRNRLGDVCVDLADYAGRPLFELEGNQSAEPPHGPDLEAWLAALGASAWVAEPGREAPLILDGTRLYLGQYFRFEQQVAEGLHRRLTWMTELDEARLAEGLARLFPSGDSETVDWQQVAAAIAVGRHFAVISGGPGTGKTTTVVKVLALLLEQDPRQRIALAAPTGKAAARLTAAIRACKGALPVDAEVLAGLPEEASTIHRLLGVRRDGRFQHDGDDPLPLDGLVVDEASMIDLPLMARLLAALPGHARLILLGDRDQLASVEAGNVLGDITGHGQAIAYGREQVQRLDRLGAAPPGRLPSGDSSPRAADAVALLRVSHRFGAASGIGALAVQVNAGQGEAALALLDDAQRDDIAWLDARPDVPHPACIDWAVDRYAAYLQQSDVREALPRFESARVLAALHGGPFGVEELNRRIAARLESRGLIGGGEDYHGKPVMVTRNDYEVGLFNGDIGLLWRDADAVLRAYFPLADGEVRRLPVRQLPEHACAYALTVHKAQGSEFDEILLVLPHDPSPVVTRELLYTGITRARRQVTLQGDRAAFSAGCERRVQRSSALAEKLGWGERRE